VEKANFKILFSMSLRPAGSQWKKQISKSSFHHQSPACGKSVEKENFKILFSP
jgi:hypothetical protein